jgi:hypothetical protein
MQLVVVAMHAGPGLMGGLGASYKVHVPPFATTPDLAAHHQIAELTTCPAA